MPSSRKIHPIERIIAAGTYLTAGMLGFVWLIIAALLKKSITNFLMYHILQSVFISIAYFLLVQLSKMVFVVLYRIPLINAIPYYINLPMPLFAGMSLIQTVVTGVVLYLTISAFMGMYSYIPWASDIIKSNLGIK